MEDNHEVYMNLLVRVNGHVRDLIRAESRQNTHDPPI